MISKSKKMQNKENPKISNFGIFGLSKTFLKLKFKMKFKFENDLEIQKIAKQGNYKNINVQI
jgi:hypothetical protein